MQAINISFYNLLKNKSRAVYQYVPWGFLGQKSEVILNWDFYI